jgi:hypothetical protein
MDNSKESGLEMYADEGDDGTMANSRETVFGASSSAAHQHVEDEQREDAAGTVPREPALFARRGLLQVSFFSLTAFFPGSDIQKVVALLQQASGQPAEEVALLFNEVDEAMSFLLQSQPIGFEDSCLVWEALWQVVEGTDDALVRARVMNTAALFLRLDLARMAGVSSAEHVGTLAEVCCSFVAMSYIKLEELSGEESFHEDVAAEWLHATAACVQYVVGAGIHLYECKLFVILLVLLLLSGEVSASII